MNCRGSTNRLAATLVGRTVLAMRRPKLLMASSERSRLRRLTSDCMWRNPGMGTMRVKSIRLATLFGVGLIATSLCLSAQVASLRPVYQVVVDVDPVAVDVAVTDSLGRSVTELTRDDFIVYEDGQPQTLRSAHLIGMPYSILVLVD